MPELQFRKASRKAVPMLIGISGVSGSGKTFSALLLAAGIAGENGRVGFIDTENGRGEMYADSPAIMKALPDGYDYARLDPPFSPTHYSEAIGAAESAGITVLVIDSLSHEWEGYGGCEEIAEENADKKGTPNWKMAKKLNKRFMFQCLSSPLHTIFCVRAREKVQFIDDPFKKGKKKVVPLGIQPVCEKNTMYEMMVSFRVEEDTHFAIPIKVPEPLRHLFSGTVLVTDELGKHIREWNDGGKALGDHEQITKRAKAAAADGVAAYKAFYAALTNAQKKALRDSGAHEENKFDAEQADAATVPADDGGEL